MANYWTEVLEKVEQIDALTGTEGEDVARRTELALEELCHLVTVFRESRGDARWELLPVAEMNVPYSLLRKGDKVLFEGALVEVAGKAQDGFSSPRIPLFDGRRMYFEPGAVGPAVSKGAFEERRAAEELREQLTKLQTNIILRYGAKVEAELWLGGWNDPKTAEVTPPTPAPLPIPMVAPIPAPDPEVFMRARPGEEGRERQTRPDGSVIGCGCQGCEDQWTAGAAARQDVVLREGDVRSRPPQRVFLDDLAMQLVQAPPPSWRQITAPADPMVSVLYANNGARIDSRIPDSALLLCNESRCTQPHMHVTARFACQICGAHVRSERERSSGVHNGAESTISLRAFLRAYHRESCGYVNQRNAYFENVPDSVTFPDGLLPGFVLP
jgi:hypothetical protein